MMDIEAKLVGQLEGYQDSLNESNRIKPEDQINQFLDIKWCNIKMFQQYRMQGIIVEDLLKFDDKN